MNHQVHKFEQDICIFISIYIYIFCKYIAGNKKKIKEKVTQNHKTGVSQNQSKPLIRSQRLELKRSSSSSSDQRIMSSDDEDELLQMALKEQSQRDLTYQKPPSSSSRKPVANLVQQPRQQKPAPPKKSAAAAARKPSMDDDDESEVELLSISSGDDDLERDRETGGGGGAGKGRGSDVRERGGRAKKEDDGAWDGEEPDCWKRVNEAEVRYLFDSRVDLILERINSRSLVMV